MRACAYVCIIYFFCLTRTLCNTCMQTCKSWASVTKSSSLQYKLQVEGTHLGHDELPRSEEKPSVYMSKLMCNRSVCLSIHLIQREGVGVVYISRGPFPAGTIDNRIRNIQ